MNTKNRTFITVLSLLVVVAALPAWGQTNTNPSGNPEGKIGVYDVSQSIEFGGRIVDQSGSKSIWSTFVNQNSGPRLLEETFDMHAPMHNGLMFDDLSLNTFGYGGDPNSVARLKVLKGKWYSFQVNFRRDKSFFDYNLLANPMNPGFAGVTAPNVAFTISPHLTDLTRKMQDYNLELFPVSRFKVRLGYAFQNQYGDVFSSSHFGTEPDYTRPWRTQSSTYKAGFTYRLFQGTSVRFDHQFTHFKNDTSAVDQHQLFTLNGRPLDLGVPFAGAPFNAPCASPIVNGAVNPVCNGYYAYTQFQPIRSDIPMDTIGFTSSWKRLDQSAHVFYSGGDVWVPQFNEFLDGLTTRTNTRITGTTGNMFNRRVSSGADYAATIRLSDHFRLVESFRWDAYRIPSSYAFDQNSQFGASLTTTPPQFSPTTCPAPYTAATCPQHTTSSSADVIHQIYNNFEGDDLKSNIISLEFDVNRHLGGHVGWKAEDKTITLRGSDAETMTYYPGAATASAAKTSARNALCVGGAVDANGVCRIDVNNVGQNEVFNPSTKGAIFGVWLRTNDKFRASFDSEMMQTKHPFTIIAPKSYQLFRVKSVYKPSSSVMVAAGGNFLHKSNDESADNRQHSNAVFFDTSFAASEKFGLDLGYTYSDVGARSTICYWGNPNTLGNPLCPLATTNVQYLTASSFYKDRSNFGSLAVTLKPTSRMQTAFGYTLTTNQGDALFTSVYQSPGPLDSIYHQPFATVAFDLNKALTFKTAWNYYGYEEGSYQIPGITTPRDARGNIFTLSLKYKMGGAR